MACVDVGDFPVGCCGSGNRRRFGCGSFGVEEREGNGVVLELVVLVGCVVPLGVCILTEIGDLLVGDVAVCE